MLPWWKPTSEKLARLTQLYEKEDPQKYSLLSYNRGLSAYSRVWQTTPSSKRIVEDIDAIANKYQEIIKNKDFLCPADKNIGGNRYHKCGGHKGRREKE